MRTRDQSNPRFPCSYLVSPCIAYLDDSLCKINYILHGSDKTYCSNRWIYRKGDIFSCLVQLSTQWVEADKSFHWRILLILLILLWSWAFIWKIMLRIGMQYRFIWLEWKNNDLAAAQWWIKVCSRLLSSWLNPWLAYFRFVICCE